MTIAMDTLRFEDPSTLLETHALDVFRQEKVRESNDRAHIVLATGRMVYQIYALAPSRACYVYSRTIG